MHVIYISHNNLFPMQFYNIISILIYNLELKMAMHNPELTWSTANVPN